MGVILHLKNLLQTLRNIKISNKKHQGGATTDGTKSVITTKRQKTLLSTTFIVSW